MDLSKELIITTDCAGSIGIKENDQVKVDYKTLSFYTLRNAVMENIAKGGDIFSIIYGNFCGDDAFLELNKGMIEVINQLGENIFLLGSTESNFVMKESAFSVTVIGNKNQLPEKRFPNYAVIGLPLVGEEVLHNKDNVVSLEEVLVLSKSDNVSRIIPIGSKGINDRAEKVLGFTFESAMIDLYKSAGPSTCLLVEYESYKELEKESCVKITKIERI